METSTLQFHLHYYFEDKTRHSLDAFIRNENEKDILLVLKKTCELFGASGTIIEIIPPAEGGLLDRYKIIIRKSLPYANVILLAFTAYWTYQGVKSQMQANDSQLKVNESQIKVNELDYQLKTLELRDKLKKIEQDSLTNAKRKQLTGEIVTTAVDTLSSDYKSRYHRSQFYTRSHKVTPVIQKISTQSLDEHEAPLEKEKVVKRTDFNSFVLRSGSIAPLIDNYAVITIIAPVITGGNYKWRGWYKDEEIQFTMADYSFRQGIQFGKIEFTGGSTIECVLEIKRKFDENSGEIRNGAKTVLRVKAHTLNNVRTEFKHTKKLKHERDTPSSTQLDFFGSKR